MKKAQVTLFIIIVAVILILVIGTFYILKQTSLPEDSQDEVLSDDFKLVAGFVDYCTQQITLKAIRQTGSHGGYIDPVDPQITPNHLAYSPDASKSELVSFGGTASNLVPYYLHVPGQASSANYNYASAAPTLQNMQEQIENYLRYNLPACIESNNLDEQGIDAVFDNSNLTPKVIIRDDDVAIFLDYPVALSKEDSTSRYSKFDIVVNFPIKKYHDLALSITAAQFATQFSESYTSALISYYSGVDFTSLPPKTSYDSKPYIVTWTQSKVKNDLDGLLVSYTPAIQVMNSSGYVAISGSSAQDAFLRSLSLDLFNETLEDISVTFFYRPGSLSLRVEPSQGQIIKPGVDVTAATRDVPEERTNSYKFFYDLSYPVFVEIRGIENQTSIPGYSFIFAMEANLIENKAPLAWQLGFGTRPWDESNLNISYTYPGITQTGEEVEFTSTPTAKTFFCNLETWVSGNYTLEVLDDSGNKLPDASISFSCADYASCYISSTNLNQATFSLPICQGGVVAISKEGFGSKAIELSTFEGSSGNLGQVRLLSKKELTASVEKLTLEKVFTRDTDWDWTAGMDSLGSASPIDESYEQVILTLTQVDQGLGAEPATATVIFGKDEDIVNISLVPGEYAVNAVLIDYNGITIPNKCSRECADRGFLGIGCSQWEYYPEEDINLVPANWGGVELNPDNLNTFKITKSQLEASSKIKFKVIRLEDLSRSTPPGGCIEALSEVGMVSDYSQKYASQLMPELN